MMRIKNCIAKLNRKNRNRDMQQRLMNYNFTIFSQNCTGGVIYHDLGIQFLSPTINMFFYADDFLKFVENWRHYTEIYEMKYVESSDPWPVAMLDDIKINLVHYKNICEASKAWRRRCKRINSEKIIIIMTDRDGFNPSLLPRISALPYKKILFTANKYDYDFCITIKEFSNLDTVGIITNFANFKGRRYYETSTIDIVDFINNI